ncbi:hypothetical protein C8J57DRAFT_1273924, partial [Mycena rebaudengoi]
MSVQSLQICPHSCGCDVSDEAVAIMARRPWWLGRCPVYESTGTGMRYHLTREMHKNCRPGCPVYQSSPVCGRALTVDEFQSWVPQIGHLSQFHSLIPTEYQNLINPDATDPDSLPSHPLFPLPNTTPAAVADTNIGPPPRYEDFFSSFSSKPSSRHERSAPGSLSQDRAASSEPKLTYEAFFGSNFGQDTSNQARGLRVLPARVGSQQPSHNSTDINSEVPNPSLLPPISPLPKTYAAFFGTPEDPPLPPLPPRARAPKPSAPPKPSATESSQSTPRRQPNPSSSVAAPPPPPPDRDLATFQRILSASTPEIVNAAVLSAYTLVPSVQAHLWNSLSATATAPDGSLHLVARHQVCRHCAELFDTTIPGAHCTWHYGTAVPDRARWEAAVRGAEPLHDDPTRFYFWDCCGGSVNVLTPGCITTAHAAIDVQGLRAGPIEPEPPTSKKRKRGRPAASAAK